MKNTYPYFAALVAVSACSYDAFKDGSTYTNPTGDLGGEGRTYMGADASVWVSSDAGVASAVEDPTAPPPTERELLCRSAPEVPTPFFMSADDSNSMAQPAVVRELVRAGEAVYGTPRHYEFLNYYNFAFEPAEEGSLRIVPELRPTGSEAGEFSLLVGVVAPSAPERRPLNLVFSVDTSGSMSGGGRERSLDVLQAVASSLREGDLISIVEWSDVQSVLLDGHSAIGPDDPAVLGAIARLSNGGSTDLDQGLRLAYELATAHHSSGRLSRVILISDGGANTGVTSDALIGAQAADAEAEGIYLVGVGAASGPGYLSESFLDHVTDLGKGAYVYVDSAEEAREMFTGNRLISTLDVAALDVRLSMTLPSGVVIKRFFGEEISTVAEEVKPQHLAANDAMLYQTELTDCAAMEHTGAEEIVFEVTWKDPFTHEAHSTSVTHSVSELLLAPANELVKSQALVAYADALFGVGEYDAAQAAIAAARTAAPDDTDLVEVERLLSAARR